jgi:hypothetical protein
LRSSSDLRCDGPKGRAVGPLFRANGLSSQLGSRASWDLEPVGLSSQLGYRASWALEPVGLSSHGGSRASGALEPVPLTAVFDCGGADAPWCSPSSDGVVTPAVAMVTTVFDCCDAGAPWWPRPSDGVVTVTMVVVIVNFDVVWLGFHRSGKVAVAAALLSTMQGCLGLQPAARTVHGARSVARGAHCSDRHQRLHRAPCATSTLAVHSSARHALQLRAASRCSVACALLETAQGCGSVRSTLLERCRSPAVHVVRWGFVGGSFQRTARAVNLYYFRSSVGSYIC